MNRARTHRLEQVAVFAGCFPRPVGALFSCLLAAAYCLPASTGSAAVATPDTEPIRLPQIPPGTPIADDPPAGWSHLVFKSRSELASGDLNAVPEWSAELTRVLFTAMIARVRPLREGEKTLFRLEKVAIGLGTRIGSRDVILSSDTQEALGANLGPIKKLMLSRGEDRLKSVLQVARTDTMIIVDAPQTMLVDTRHRIVIFRYVFLVHPVDGSLATVVWRINLGQNGIYQLDSGDAVRMRPNLLATCPLHVDGREFTAGIPSSMAFATTRLPVGEPLPMTDALRSVAGQKRFTAGAIGFLEAAVRGAVGFPLP